MRNRIKVDLPLRTERRYVILTPGEFLNSITPYVERKKFSDSEYVQTIYFNNEEHAVPFGFSIKARQYLPQIAGQPILDDREKYFLDLKQGQGENKQKERLETTLGEATKIVNERHRFSEIPLRPYVAVQYLRRHYIPKGIEDVRLTLDSEQKYFFFPSHQKESIEIGEVDGYVQLEIKQKSPNAYFDNLVKEILTNSNAFPVISKKFTAYNFLGLYHAKTSGKPFHKELQGYEIESKLVTDSESVFPKVKRLFEAESSDFKLPAHFPYTFESASINRYYRSSKGLFKAMLRRNEVEIVRKGDIEVVEDPFGLNCVLKRKEVKGEIIPIDSEIVSTAELQGELYRMRKAFWVENPRSSRFYHISLDCCLGLPGTFYEVEVEYSGRYGGPEVVAGDRTEEEIVEDIAKISMILIREFPELKPTQLTKQSWLGVE